MINPFAKSERVRRQAARWFARLQGPATNEDRVAFERWRKRDPAHDAAFQRISGHWRAAANVRPERLRPAVPRQAPEFRHRLAWVAASGLILTAGMALLTGIAPPFVSAGKAQELNVKTAIGEIRTVTLMDGTRLTLDTRSAATVRFDTSRRFIRIDRGRARIAWTRDERPLRIEAGEAIDVEGAGAIDVAEDGGSFLVRAAERPVALKIASGRREVGAEPPLRLPLGASEQPAAQPHVADPDWPSGVLDFRSEPMGSAVARANRYASSPLILVDPSLANERVSGRYKAGDTAGLAAALAAAFDLEVTRSPTGAYRLGRKAGRAIK